MLLRKICAMFLVLVMMFAMATPMTVLADETKTSKVDFYITERSEGIVEVEMTIKDAHIIAFQTAIRYNKEAITPVDESNTPTSDFDKFAVREEKTSCFQEIGTSLDIEKGLFGFTVFIMPGTRHEAINSENEYVADESGAAFYKFRFKRINDGEYDFEVALKDDKKPYQPALTDGLIMTNTKGVPEVQVSFSTEAGKLQESIIAPEVIPDRVEDHKPDTQIVTSQERKKDVICLRVGENLTITYGKKKVIDEENPLVVPYIKEERTLVPLRYIAESLGATVLWESGWNGCVIKKDDKEIEITFGSAEFKVNGETVVYDTPIEVVHDRTMVPVRFISEELGCDVYWNQLNSAVVISPINNPWVEDRKAEITALNEMLISIIGLL